ncbi:lysylphosphatidylglycerol synthase domain-containing protein [Gulosibacter sediminis]|uniref:lysylphosphatidylglycerol synthase domain-containing protein n=1 Tax=Gulosibacter sediminis TaxID=1729695 RepID=UPI0024A8FB4D|nr:lysylphosphatidylglycerol synthase domain-containing protein [Gulosibacter sediminis]
MLFLVVALAFGVWAVVAQWDSLVDAVAQVNPWILVLAVVLSIVYVSLTFGAWRRLMLAQHDRLKSRDAARVFFVSQLGKYLPGGIWNIVAAAELGKDHEISRLHSVVVMVQSTLISIASGLCLGAIGIAVGPPELRAQTWWVLLALPFALVALTPAVINRITAVVLRRVGREQLRVSATWQSVGVASAWSVGAWVVAGLQVWILSLGLGLSSDLSTLGLCVLAYALAWTVGFLVIVAPAGIGIREGVLGLLLAGQLTSGAVVALVLLSRIAFTIADVLAGLLYLRRGSTQQADASGLAPE